MKKIPQLPRFIKVRIFQGKSGAWIAELPDYDIHTEADSPLELDFMINDLIYAHFDVPDRFRGEVRYVPALPKRRKARALSMKKFLRFQKFVSPEAHFVFD